MGVQNAAKVLWTGKNIRPGELIHIYERVHQKKDKIRLDVDILNFYHDYADVHDTYNDVMKAVAKKLFIISSFGFRVTAIVDGLERPFCKRSSWDRKKQKLLDIHNSIYCQQTAKALASTMDPKTRSKTQMEEDRLRLQNLNKEYDKLAKNNNNEAHKEIPATFASDLESYIFNYKISGSTYSDADVDEKVHVALYQADSMIAYRVKNNLSDGYISEDTDFQILLGPAHFNIRGASKIRKKDADDDLVFDISGSSNDMMERLKNINPRVEWNKALFPVLDLVSPVMRALVAICLGCDVWDGIDGMNAKGVSEALEIVRNETGERESLDGFITYIVNQDDTNTLSKEILITLCEALLHEPVIVDESTNKYEYIFGEPTSLTEYVSYFKDENSSTTQILQAPPVNICSGIPGHSSGHTYLQAEKTFKCDECSRFFCRTCGFVKQKLTPSERAKEYYEDKKENLCYSCYGVSPIEENKNIPSIAEMRKWLAEVPLVETQNKTSDDVIEKLYLHHKSLREPMYYKKSTNPPFPKHKSTWFETIKPSIIYDGPLLTHNGFLHNIDIKNELVPEIIILMCKMLQFQPIGSSPYARACPEIIIKFANQSRLNVGAGDNAHKVIKYCIRTATDERTRPILRENVQLFYDGTTVGMILTNKVPPSMNSQQYDSKVAFTASDLLCCDCTCLSSGKDTKNNMDNVTCAHSLPPIMQLSLDFDRGYVSHFLSDVAAIWTKDVEVEFRKKRQKYRRTKDHLLMLIMNAKGLKEQDLVQVKSKKYIFEILDIFKSRTDLPDIDLSLPPSTFDLHLFRDLPIISNEKFAESLRKHRDDDVPNPDMCCQFIGSGTIPPPTIKKHQENNQNNDIDDCSSRPVKRQKLLEKLMDREIARISCEIEKSSCALQELTTSINTFLTSTEQGSDMHDPKIGSNIYEEAITPVDEGMLYQEETNEYDDDNDDDSVMSVTMRSTQEVIEIDDETDEVIGLLESSLTQDEVILVSSPKIHYSQETQSVATTSAMPETTCIQDEVILDSSLKTHDSPETQSGATTSATADHPTSTSTSTSTPTQIIQRAFDLTTVDPIEINKMNQLFQFDVRQSNDAAEIVVNLGAKSVNKKSFASLDDNVMKNNIEKYVTDEVIDAYSKLLVDEMMISRPRKPNYIFTACFMKKLMEGNVYRYKNVARWNRLFPVSNIFNDLDKLFVPISIENSHWALIICNMQIKKISYLDPFGWCGQRHLCAMYKYLEDLSRKKNKKNLVRSEWTLEDLSTSVPQQENGFDCGIYVMIYMYLKMHNLPLSFTQDSVYRCSSRRIIAHTLLSAAATNSSTISTSIHAPVDVVPLPQHHEAIRRATSVKTVKYEEPKPWIPHRTRKRKPSHQSPKKENNIKNENNNNNHHQKILDDSIKMVKCGVSNKEEMRDEHNLPVFEKTNVDYIRLYLLLEKIFDGLIPSNFIGYRLIKSRYLLQIRELDKSPNSLNNFLTTQRRNAARDWDKLCIKSAEERLNTTKIEKIHTDGTSVIRNGENEEMIFPPTKPRKLTNGYKSTRRTCNFEGCKCSHKTRGIFFERVPAKKEKEQKKRLRDQIKHEGQILLRKTILRRMGIKEETDQRKEFRICSNHPREIIKMTHKVERNDPTLDPVEVEYTMVVPKAVGDKSRAQTVSKGCALERAVYRAVNDISIDGNENLAMFAIRKIAEEEEEDLPKERRGLVTEQIKKKMKLRDIPSDLNRLRMKATPKRKYRKKKNIEVRGINMSDREVKRRTGFKSKKIFLAYLVIINNGDTTNMVKTTAKHLTWFEEHFLFFESIWMRTLTRGDDVAHEYMLRKATKDIIFNKILWKVLITRNSWKKYCTHAEDVAMRGEKWKDIFDLHERVIMHDQTSLRLCYKPSRAKSQKITYARYYNGNVAKGNVSLQLCGWIVTDLLWVGATSDDHYMIHTRILEGLAEFAKSDTESKKQGILPFINILDRGYRLSAHAFKCGKQTCRQPAFKKRKRRFTACETLKSATVAGIRSGNERAVGRAKLCGWLRKGLRPHECPRRFDDVWLAWGFTCNFMYAPVA